MEYISPKYTSRISTKPDVIRVNYIVQPTGVGVYCLICIQQDGQMCREYGSILTPTLHHVIKNRIDDPICILWYMYMMQLSS